MLQRLGGTGRVVVAIYQVLGALSVAKFLAEYVVFSVFFSLYGVHLGVLQRLGGTEGVAVARCHVLVFFLLCLCFFWCLCSCVLLVCCKDWVGQGGWRLPGGTYLFFFFCACVFLVFVFLCSSWCVAKIGWDREGGGCQVPLDQEV